MKNSSKVLTLIIQHENIYWIAFHKDKPKERWTGSSIGDAIEHFLDRIYPDDEDISLNVIIKRRNK